MEPTFTTYGLQVAHTAANGFAASREQTICKSFSTDDFEVVPSANVNRIFYTWKKTQDCIALVAHDWIEFRNLHAQWKKEREVMSFVFDMAMCPSYHSIIGMGKDRVIPLILRQIEDEGDEPDHWFWALRVLTRADPVADKDRGIIKRMAASWLKWAEGKYVW